MTDAQPVTAETVTAETVAVLGVDGHPVAVEIQQAALKQLGYIHQSAAGHYCSHDPDAPNVSQVMKAWHERAHAGAYSSCYEQPCRDVREVT